MTQKVISSHIPWIKLEDLEQKGYISFLRGSGISKKDFDNKGKFPCIHYGDLYTAYQEPEIRQVVHRTNFDGKIRSHIGDVLIPATTTADEMGIAIARAINKKGVILGGDINILRTENKYLLSTYLSYIFNYGIKRELASYAKGTNILHLSNKDVRKLLIPVPPLPEQKRIVEKLDKIFADIDKAKENTTKNLQNAKEVFDSFLDNVFTEKSASWTQKALGDILSKEKYSMKRGPFGSALRKSFFVPQGIRVFEQYNPINNDPHWKRYFISQEKYKELEAFTAQAGDLLVSCSGSLGKIVELPQNTETGIINQALLKIKLEQTLILNSFFIYWFRSPHVQTLIREKTNGVAIPNLIAVKELKKIKVPVPSRSIQEQIVKKLNFLRAKTQELEQIYTKKLADLDELKQSVLQQAFSGKL